ncbi:hypothetical protein QFZ30_003120 [Arthrobacter pascens]|nr:hypothetical protein [Arthrobacter pascens]
MERRVPVLAPPCLYDSRRLWLTYCRSMGMKQIVALEGQTSINDLLEEPIGATHI